jgi:poly(A) polymerase/tRNA nucleotidyltransferase (CCA-adding enzyme)
MLLPEIVKQILQKLEQSGHEAYAVGGCVRDVLLKIKPKDWDITTSAKPEEIQEVFPNSFYENRFGTVTIKTKSPQNSQKLIEVTTFRSEGEYEDFRHPRQVGFISDLKGDLARRDFTVNAIAMDKKEEVIDPFEGKKDLENRLIKTVGEPEKRFTEDALRMMRAVRLAAELDFKIEPETFESIKKNADRIQPIAKERIRDEFIKIIMSYRPDEGLDKLYQGNLLKHVIPELTQGAGVSQNKHHIYTIYEHSVFALKFAAQRGYSLEVRLAALFHDIAKPQTKSGEGPEATFYNHDIVGAKFAVKILKRLKFPKKTTEKVAHLIKNHMFVYDTEEVTEAGVRRLLKRVGKENINDLIKLRIADRLGSGCPKAVPYKLRHLQYIVDKVSQDPVSTKMLAIDGNDVMEVLNLAPGPRVGFLMDALLAEVLEDPNLNQREELIHRLKELNRLSDKELKQKNKTVKEKKEEIDRELKSKYWVK